MWKSRLNSYYPICSQTSTHTRRHTYMGKSRVNHFEQTRILSLRLHHFVRSPWRHSSDSACRLKLKMMVGPFLCPLSRTILNLSDRPMICRPCMTKKRTTAPPKWKLPPILQGVAELVLLNRGAETSDLNVVVLGSLPAVDSCLSDRHVSLESHPHIPKPLSVVTTEGDRKRAGKK